MRVGFHIGPFYFSQRVGRTQAQKRAAAKAAAQRRQARQFAKQRQESERAYNDPAAVAAREAARVAAVATREAELDAEVERLRADVKEHGLSQTYRAVISACKLDALKGGSFTIEAEGRPSAVFNVSANAVLHFLSLKKGDIVQVTLKPGNAGLEEFWQLCRANGAKPRSPVELTAADMERFGLSADRPESGG